MCLFQGYTPVVHSAPLVVNSAPQPSPEPVRTGRQQETDRLRVETATTHTPSREVNTFCYFYILFHNRQVYSILSFYHWLSLLRRLLVVRGWSPFLSLAPPTASTHLKTVFSSRSRKRESRRDGGKQKTTSPHFHWTQIPWRLAASTLLKNSTSYRAQRRGVNGGKERVGGEKIVEGDMIKLFTGDFVIIVPSLSEPYLDLFGYCVLLHIISLWSCHYHSF